MVPLSQEQLRTPAILTTPAPVYQAPTPKKQSDSLYKDGLMSGPQMLIDATQSLAQEVIQMFSPAKTVKRDPLIRKVVSTTPVTSKFSSPSHTPYMAPPLRR